MIKPMIDASFCAYGNVERFGIETACTLTPIPVSGQTKVHMYSFPFDTTWDYVEGMTVLLIHDGETRKQYYLDRTVTIRGGVCFGFYSLGKESTIAGNAAIMTPDACTALLDISGETAAKQLHVFTLFRQVGRDGLFFRGERHPPLELVLVEKGILQNYCDGQKFTLHPNEFLILSENQWHMQYADREVQFLTISFSWEGYDFSHLFNRVFSASSGIQRTVHSLVQEYEQDLPEREEFLLALLKLLFLQILRLPGDEDAVKKPSPASERVHRMILDKAMQIVSERVYGKLTVSSLAAAVNVSTSQLTALFKNYLGMTPAKYITQIRLEESKGLLSEKKMSVGEIANLLGYASIQHYSKQFHDWFGYAPSGHVTRQSSVKGR